MLSYVPSSQTDWRERVAKLDKTKGSSKELMILIESLEQSYHIADHRAEIGRVDDEAIIDIHGTIVRAIDQAKALEGKRAEVSLICSQQYHCDRGHSESQPPMLMTASVLKGTFQALAYLPAKPFWALPKMIMSGRVSHIIADYRAGPRRDSELHALYFASLDKIERRE